MSITARLFMDGVFIKTMSVFDDQPPFSIRIYSCYPTRIIRRPDNSSEYAGSSPNIFRYERGKKVALKTFEYHFVGVETDANHHFSIGDSFDIGFMEPDENVNLEKLTTKLRSSKDAVPILKQYYSRLKNYGQLPPDHVLSSLKKAKVKRCFDSFAIAHIEKVKDPILFGLIKDFPTLYFYIDQWGDDVKIEDILKFD